MLVGMRVLRLHRPMSGDFGRTFRSFGSLLLFPILASCGSNSDADLPYREPTSYPPPWNLEVAEEPFVVVAHRGGTGYSPENTTLAVDNAVRIGVDAIELDVWLTLDGRLVAMHSVDVGVTTDCVGKIDQMRWDELQQCDAAFSWWPAGSNDLNSSSLAPLRGHGLKVPELREVLDLPTLGPPAPPAIWIEPKVSLGPNYLSRLQATTDAVLTEIVARPQSRFQMVLSDGRIAAAAKASAPQIGVGMTYSASSSVTCDQMVRLTANLGAEYLLLDVRAISRATVTECLSLADGRGLRTIAWTVNDMRGMKEYAELGLDGVITDYPACLLALLGRDPPSNPYPTEVNQGLYLPKCPPE